MIRDVSDFETQTKINYECSTIYCTLSFKRESLPCVAWMLCKRGWEMRDHGGKRGSGRDCVEGFAIRSFVYDVVLLLLGFLQG